MWSATKLSSTKRKKRQEKPSNNFAVLMQVKEKAATLKLQTSLQTNKTPIPYYLLGHHEQDFKLIETKKDIPRDWCFGASIYVHRVPNIGTFKCV